MSSLYMHHGLFSFPFWILALFTILVGIGLWKKWKFLEQSALVLVIVTVVLVVFVGYLGCGMFHS